MEKFKQTNKRESQFLGAATVYTVVINDAISEKFSIGTSRTYELDRKPASIRFYIKQIGITTVDKTIVLDPEDYEDITLTFRMPWKNQYSVDYDISYGQRLNVSGAFPIDTSASESSQDSAPPHRFCTVCGNPINPTDNFCSNCGTKIATTQ